MAGTICHPACVVRAPGTKGNSETNELGSVCVLEHGESQGAARIETLVGSGDLASALQEAAAWCDVDRQSVEAFRLRALTACLAGHHTVAAEAVSHARTLPGGGSAKITGLAAFIEDQRRASERASAYCAFEADSGTAMRWHSGRPYNFEIYLREHLFDGQFSEVAEMGRQLQVHAFSPVRAAVLAQRLTAVGEAVMAVALRETPPVLVLSDSHSRYFEWLVFDGLLPQQGVGVCSVSEANLYGLYAPSRNVPTRRRFREALDRFPSHSAIVLHIGEVDCRAIYWNLRQRLGAFGRQFFDTITQHFDRLLDDIAASHPRIVVTAPVRPTYLARPEDRMVDGALVLQLTNGLAAHMEAACAARGLAFVSINRDLESFGAGLGNRYFRTVVGKKGMTHHLSAPKVAGLWSRALVPHLR